jgi:hypothetical protein
LCSGKGESRCSCEGSVWIKVNVPLALGYYLSGRYCYSA